MKSSKLLILMLMILVALPSALSIGIAPAVEEKFMTESIYTYNLRIFNEHNEEGIFEIEVTGDLANYIMLDKKEVSFTRTKPHEDVKVTVVILDMNELSRPEYTNRIIVKKKDTGQGTVVARVGVASKLVITLPREGIFLETELFAPPFVNEVPNSFTIEAKNKGDKTANNCRAEITVYTDKLEAITTLILEGKTIQPRQEELFVLTWNPKVKDGTYIAKASVMCDGGIQKEMQKPFTVFSPNIRIDSFTARDFRLGGISRFDLVLSTLWPEIKDVFADIELMNGNEVIYETKTETKNLFSSVPTDFPVYIDTAGVSPGTYTIVVTTHYFEKELTEIFTAQMSNTGILINGISGAVVGGREGGTSEFSFITILLVIIIIVLIVLSIMMIKLMKKK